MIIDNPMVEAQIKRLDWKDRSIIRNLIEGRLIFWLFLHKYEDEKLQNSKDCWLVKKSKWESFQNSNV